MNTANASPFAGQLPQVFATEVSHLRREPWRAGFRHCSYLWVSDLASAEHGTGRLPSWLPARLRSFVHGRVEARDHFGNPDKSVRANLADFLARHDIELGDADVTVAAHPRALGFCFNPISVFWCTTAAGELLATVLEVHNTYGDRHAYLLRPTPASAATRPVTGASVVEYRLKKQMYVSPFHGVEGEYLVTAPYPYELLEVTVDLETDNGARFSAAMVGRPVQGSYLLAAAYGLRDALLIRLHGVALWARRLPIQPRPIHHQEGVQ